MIFLNLKRIIYKHIFLEKDASHFLPVIEANKGIIYKIANSYCKNEDNRKDLIQEIVIQLWLSFNKYDERYKLSTWIYRIALNVSISFYRKESRRSAINRALPAEVLSIHEESNAGEWQSRIEQLYRFIRSLKEIDRAVILLYLEGSSQSEIAEILGLTVTNISTKVSRIKQQLKKEFLNLNQ